MELGLAHRVDNVFTDLCHGAVAAAGRLFKFLRQNGADIMPVTTHCILGEELRNLHAAVLTRRFF